MTYLNLDSINKKRSVYRIIPADRFVKDLESGTNALAQPKLWEDPFENVVMSATGLLNGQRVSFGFRDQYFGQCWSRNKETDLLWRGYSDDGCAVKLRVRMKKLHDSLADHQGSARDVACFLGRVDYQRKGRYKDTLAAGLKLDTTNRSQAHTLLVKRYGYRSERDVRLIAYSTSAPVPPGLFVYPVNWSHLLVEVVLHPAMSPKKVSDWKKQIHNAGFNGKVFQSALYKLPKPFTVTVRP